MFRNACGFVESPLNLNENSCIRPGAVNRMAVLPSIATTLHGATGAVSVSVPHPL